MDLDDVKLKRRAERAVDAYLTTIPVVMPAVLSELVRNAYLAGVKEGLQLSREILKGDDEQWP
jgi:hypothetical protein